MTIYILATNINSTTQIFTNHYDGVGGHMEWCHIEDDDDHINLESLIPEPAQYLPVNDERNIPGCIS